MSADGLRQAVIAAAEQRFDTAVQQLLADVREAAPRRDGTLEDSVGEQARSVTETFITTTVVATAEHASWQDKGTGVYGPNGAPIVPVTAKVLAWPAPYARTASGIMFAPQVQGAPATRFWSDNVNADRWTAALEAAGS